MSNDTAFAGKVAVVTGASSGIGQATALALARAGARVVLVSRDAAALGEVATAAGGETHVVAADVTADDAPARVVGAAAERFGGIDVLVNAAGIIGTAATDATPDDLYDRMFAINVRAPFRMMREAFPHLKARRGNVVNISSVNGLRAFAGVAVYCSSKAALDHLSRCAALDWAPHGVRVNCVNPGVTVTNLHTRGGMDDDALRGVPRAGQGDASARAARDAGGDRRRGAVRGLGPRRLDDRRHHRRGRRPTSYVLEIAARG